jgi:hypothetical protein
LYADTGPFVAFLLHAQTVTAGSSNVYADKQQTIPLLPGPTSFDATENVKDSLHAANFGIEGNIGVAYMTSWGNIFLEGGGNYGFINIQKNKDDGQNNTGAATVRIGFSYLFGGSSSNAKSVREPKKF